MMFLSTFSATALAILRLADICIAQGGTTSDPYDLSWVNKWAAIGDSYAAGIGAGNRIDKGCARYDSAYPNLINVQLGKDTSGVDFQFVACSGAETPAIIKQAQNIDGGQQFITISSGGNDAQLTTILNDCVFTFKGPFSGTCEDTMTKSQQIIDSSAFTSNLDTLISTAKSKLASSGTIYYTGYAKFFDASSNDCDSVSWHIWSMFSRQYLTKDRRQKMNNLVDQMNAALKAAVARGGAQVVFVDYDPYVEQLNGRYCQPGADEDKGNSANRALLFFYESKSTDTPLMAISQSPYHDELRRRATFEPRADDPTTDTYNEIDDWILQSLEGNPTAALNDDVANSELDYEVAEEKLQLKSRKLKIRKRGRAAMGAFPPPSWNDTGFSTTSAVTSGYATLGAMKSTRSHGRISSALPTGTGVRRLSHPPISPIGSLSSAIKLRPFSTGVITGTRLSRQTGIPFHSTRNRESEGFASSTALNTTQHEMFRSLNDTSRTPGRFNITSGRRLITHNSTIHGSIHAAAVSNGTLTSHKILFNNTSKLNGKLCFTSAGKNTYLYNGTHALDCRVSSNSSIGATSLKHGALSKSLSGENFLLHPVSDSAVFSWFVSDMTKRVFHPQQGGHAMIANLIMYHIAARTAVANGITITPESASNVGASCPMALHGACNSSNIDAWMEQPAAISATSNFCSNYQNLRGSAGKITSGLYNQHSPDYGSVSINWADDLAISEGDCNLWYGQIVNGCDVSVKGFDKLYHKHGGSIGWAANATLSLSPLVKQAIWDGVAPLTARQCNADSTTNYIDNVLLATNVKHFCSQSAQQFIVNSGTKFEKDFNANTPSHVTLTTTWPSGPYNYMVFEDECLYYFRQLNDGCNIPQGGSNPMNWKHGGTMPDALGIIYTITPNRVRPPPPTAPVGSCFSWYKFTNNQYTVQGGGYASSDYGAGLLKQIRGCSAVTRWTFTYFDQPHDDGTEWEASGTTIIGKRQCTGRAVNSAGGPSGCGGNGL